jgi:eukaryotic-like serine/threonine-protein kinase
MGFHVGQTFGDYSITAVLGAGGMGRVFKVENLLTKRTEAMKVLSAELASEIQIKRFQREMRALARLSHPNIATLHNALHAEDQLILLMEYIEGQTLENMFSAGRLPLNRGLGYIQQILLALAYAHHQGVVHRDVTPANVIVTAGDQVKLTDFGLSKSFGDSLLTNCGEVLGSLPYLAPEQLKGTTQPDRRSDLYSVGAILYEHLTGQKPFGPHRRLAPVLTDSEGDPLPPSQVEPNLSRQWDDILRRALARDPVHRYQSAEVFLDAIAHLEQPAGADLPLPQFRMSRLGIALLAGPFVALFASPTVMHLYQVRSSTAPASLPLKQMHIAPPDFATVKPPLSAPTLAGPTDVPNAKEVLRAKPPHQVAAVAPHVVTTHASAKVSNIAIGSPAVAVPIAPAESEVSQAADSAVSEPDVSADPAAAKKTFWRKLNVFRKKSSEPKDKQ